MPKRIAVLVTHDFEDMEYVEPVEAFRAASHSVINIENRWCFKKYADIK